MKTFVLGLRLSLLFSNFISSVVLAQVQVDDGTVGKDARECSISFLPSSTATAPYAPLGYALACAYVESDDLVKTKWSGDNGATWGAALTVPNPGSFAHLDDEKLAAWYDASGHQQIIVYRAETKTLSPSSIDEGTYVSWTTVSGGSVIWHTPTAVETNVASGGVPNLTHTVRPCIATDLNSGSSTQGNAYIAWTTTDDANNSSVRFRVFSTSHTLSSTVTVQSSTSSSTKYDACDIAVSSDGTPVVLWRETDKSTANGVPDNRKLFLSVFSNSGGTWSFTTFQVLVTPSTSPRPYKQNVGDYQDYPCLAISQSQM